MYYTTIDVNANLSPKILKKALRSRVILVAGMSRHSHSLLELRKKILYMHRSAVRYEIRMVITSIEHILLLGIYCILS